MVAAVVAAVSSVASVAAVAKEVAAGAVTKEVAAAPLKLAAPLDLAMLPI